jgi:hypothetical protein
LGCRQIKIWLLCLVVSCTPEFPEVEPPGPTIRRLSVTQYTNSIHDVFGDSVVVPDRLEPDASVDGYISVGASFTTVSPRGVELYEAASFSITEQLFEIPEVANTIRSCEATDILDTACSTEILEAYGLRLWRRPLSSDETEVVIAIAEQAASTLGSFDSGIQYGLAFLLQSPNFLFRIELGETDPELPGSFRFSSFEMAARLSFFLWNTTPDDALLEAAAADDLTDTDRLAEQVDRLMASPRARAGFRNFVDEYLELYGLEDLKKDPLIFTHMDADAGPSAREETLLNFETLVFEEDGDYRDILLSDRTFVNRKLASMYDVAAPARDGFAELRWGEDEPRQGLLTQASVLSLHAHAVSTSATLRGKFIREKLLCQELPPPPSDLNTALPDVTESAPTLRDRVEQHMSDPSCAVCHEMMDPLGLGLENFDGLGRFRLRENGEMIDASGDLDGLEYDGPKGLAQVLSDSDDFRACFVAQIGRYANGRMEAGGESAGYEHLSKRFKRSRYRVQGLMREFMLSPAFRAIGEVE